MLNILLLIAHVVEAASVTGEWSANQSGHPLQLQKGQEVSEPHLRACFAGHVISSTSSCRTFLCFLISLVYKLLLAKTQQKEEEAPDAHLLDLHPVFHDYNLENS